MLGLYPVGTLVELDTREMGLVVETREGSDGDRPIVRLLVPQGRRWIQEGKSGGFERSEPCNRIIQENPGEEFSPLHIRNPAVEFLL